MIPGLFIALLLRWDVRQVMSPSEGGREKKREREGREREARERQEAPLALGPRRGHTPGYFGRSDQVDSSDIVIPGLFVALLLRWDVRQIIILHRVITMIMKL